MNTGYAFETESGRLAKVLFSVTSDSSPHRRFGISASIAIDGVHTDSNIAVGRYFTYEEACRAIDMLCRFKVTPCTLCDII